MNDVRPAGATSQFDIRIEDKTYTGADGTPVPAIRDLVLEVRPQSMTVLMGPSGCGKTTLLRILAGLDTNFTGTVHVPDNARIGVMFQEPRLLPWRTVRQNIQLVAEDLSNAELEHLAASVEIADKLPRYPQELSLGLARRVALGARLRAEARPAPARRTLRLARRAHRRPLAAPSARGVVGAPDDGDPRHPQSAGSDPSRRSAGAARAAADPCGCGRADFRAARRSATPAMVEEIYADLLKRHPANFATG